MTLEELLFKFEKIKKELEKEKQNTIEELEEIKKDPDLFNNDSLNLNFQKSKYNLFALFLRANIKDPKVVPLTIKQGDKFTSSITNLEVMNEFFKTLRNISDHLKEKDVSKFINMPIGEIVKKIQEISEEEIPFVDMVDVDDLSYTEILSNIGYNIEDLIKLYNIKKDNNVLFAKALTVATFSIKAKEFSDKVKKDPKITFTQKEKIISDYINSFQTLRNAKTTINIYFEKLQAKEKNRQKRLDNQISKYNQLEQELKKLSEEDIILEDTINKIAILQIDEGLKKDILKYIYAKNNIFYQKLEQDIKKLTKNKIILLKYTLNSYGITPDMYNIEDFLKFNEQDLTDMLKRLSLLNIKDSKDLLTILKNSDIKTIEYIEKFVSKKVLTKDFIVNNINIFNKESIEYKNMMENINTLTDSNILLVSLPKNQETLLFNKDKIKESLKILSEYNLIDSIKKGTDLGFLQTENLDILIDKILELGFEKSLISNLNLLNYDQNKWNRVHILNELKEDILSTTKLIKVLEDNNFIVPDDKLENYIFSYIPSYINEILTETSSNCIKQEEKEELKPYISTDLTYNIDGVIISRNKVKRSLDKLSGIDLCDEEKLLYSIANNKVLTEEEYQNIKAICQHEGSKNVKNFQKCYIFKN